MVSNPQNWHFFKVIFSKITVLAEPVICYATNAKYFAHSLLRYRNKYTVCFIAWVSSTVRSALVASLSMNRREISQNWVPSPNPIFANRTFQKNPNIVRIHELGKDRKNQRVRNIVRLHVYESVVRIHEYEHKDLDRCTDWCDSASMLQYTVCSELQLRYDCRIWLKYQYSVRKCGFI